MGITGAQPLQPVVACTQSDGVIDVSAVGLCLHFSLSRLAFRDSRTVHDSPLHDAFPLLPAAQVIRMGFLWLFLLRTCQYGVCASALLRPHPVDTDVSSSAHHEYEDVLRLSLRCGDPLLVCLRLLSLQW